MNSNLSDTTSDTPFQLFISYAHKGEERKNRLLTALAPYKRNGLIETWNDREIMAGDDWEAEINAALKEAHAAIFMLDEYFLASNFCLDKEVMPFLQRHRDEGAVILFVLGDHCNWDAYDFIKKFQIVPSDNKPITATKPHSKAYTAVAKAIEKKLLDHRKEQGLPQRGAIALAKSEPVSGSFQDLLAKLPSATTHLFGRDNEIEQINQWKDHKGIFLWVAEGGTGKSALVRWWLAHQEWPRETRFLGHSFYSQGSHNQATSSRSFLLDALKQLAIKHEDNAADDELGHLLAEAVAASPTVLVLDGIEPLQQLAKDDAKLNGMVKDRGLAALLEGLARQPGQALCLASSRLPIPESSIADAIYFKEKTLGLLPANGALQLLQQRGVRGMDDELGKMVERCGNHPLALVLAAEFCHTFLQDNASAFMQLPWQPQIGEAHAATVMALFDNALAEEQQTLDRELVRILGLFDRPAPWGALLALKSAAPITSLTVALHDADETAIMESLARLRQWGLLNADLTRREPELDAHPLVREHFGRLLEQEDTDAWRVAHGVLFDWFCNQPSKKLPDSLEELEPLYRAIGHGCKAGRYLTALDRVYRKRIQRGDEGYSGFQLGGFSTDLAALAGFFPQGWNQPPVAAGIGLPGEALTEAARIWLRGDLAICFVSLGWLEQAFNVLHIARERQKECGDWINFCLASSNLADIHVALGQWQAAEKASREALGAATNITDADIRWQIDRITLCNLGRALHGQGFLENALLAFKQAETKQLRHAPRVPQLHSSSGYYYAQLLLERSPKTKGWREVLERGCAALKIDKRIKRLSPIAHDHCTIGTALAMLKKSNANTALDLAVTTMQRASKFEFQPPMFLARADYRRAINNLSAAWSDLNTAYSIAQRGNMRTYLAECALLAGNLYLDEGLAPEAAAQYSSAAQFIREDGYGRRLTELHLLHARVLHAQHDPAAGQALTDAEARIREVGQWFFWRELCKVAKEIGAPDPGKCP